MKYCEPIAVPRKSPQNPSCCQPLFTSAPSGGVVLYEGSPVETKITAPAENVWNNHANNLNLPSERINVFGSPICLVAAAPAGSDHSKRFGLSQPTSRIN